MSLDPLDNLIHTLYHKHITASVSFAEKILSDQTHPLHEDISRCRSHISIRSRFRLLPARINLYKTFVVIYLARILTDKDEALAHLFDLFDM